MFIYKITNILNDKVYIGLTTKSNVKNRFYQHMYNAFKTNLDTYFYNAIRKHGRDNFKIETIETCSDFDELNFLEKYYIKFYNSTDKRYGYNLLAGGTQCKMTEEIKLKVSKSRKEQYKNGYKNPKRYYTRKDIIFKPSQSSEQHRFKLSLIKQEYYSHNKHIQAKKTLCINDGKVFDSAAKAGQYYNIPITAPARVCNGSRKSYKGLVFKYL